MRVNGYIFSKCNSSCIPSVAVIFNASVFGGQGQTLPELGKEVDFALAMWVESKCKLSMENCIIAKYWTKHYLHFKPICAFWRSVFEGKTGKDRLYRRNIGSLGKERTCGFPSTALADASLRGYSTVPAGKEKSAVYNEEPLVVGRTHSKRSSIGT